MSGIKHTILCVDDEKNIANALKRLLRKEGYRLLTASSGQEGLDLLKENEIHLVLCDQRMPEMSGTEFLANVKAIYPDIIRIILTGYTEVDAITESINKGNIYKFFLKPWDDQSLKLEIKQALEQYDLIKANRALHEKVLMQNKDLQKINDNLESIVKKRTEDLEIQNQALELSRIILEDIPIPVIGVGAEGMIVMINSKVQELFDNGRRINVGKNFSDYFQGDIKEVMTSAMSSNSPHNIRRCLLSEKLYEIDFTPLSGMFSGRGIVLTFRPMEN